MRKAPLLAVISPVLLFAGCADVATPTSSPVPVRVSPVPTPPDLDLGRYPPDPDRDVQMVTIRAVVQDGNRPLAAGDRIDLYCDHSSVPFALDVFLSDIGSDAGSGVIAAVAVSSTTAYDISKTVPSCQTVWIRLSRTD